VQRFQKGTGDLFGKSLETPVVRNAELSDAAVALAAAAATATVIAAQTAAIITAATAAAVVAATAAAAAATTVSAVAAATAATTTAAAAAARTVFGFADAKGATAEFGAVKGFHRAFADFAAGEGDKGEAPGTTGVPVERHVEIHDGFVGGEEFA
jgi:ABC-type multidrug transport system fused ATPase/permease subunit